MAPLKQHPRYNIVSVRISDEEKEILTKISIRNRLSISDVCREALYANFFSALNLYGPDAAEIKPDCH